MSITITTDVFCDICSNWVFGATAPRSKVRFARYRAKKAGWVRRRRGGKLIDICPLCQKEEEANA